MTQQHNNPIPEAYRENVLWLIDKKILRSVISQEISKWKDKPMETQKKKLKKKEAKEQENYQLINRYTSLTRNPLRNLFEYFFFALLTVSFRGGLSLGSKI